MDGDEGAGGPVPYTEETQEEKTEREIYSGVAGVVLPDGTEVRLHDEEIKIIVNKKEYVIPPAGFKAGLVTGSQILTMVHGQDWDEYTLNAKRNDGSGVRDRIGPSERIPADRMKGIERFETIRKYAQQGEDE